jgi:anti-sigma factor RsiW
MTANHTPENADADLIRYLDGELAADERSRVEAALATDAGLAGRFAVLKRRSTRLAALLGTIAPSAAETAAADPSRMYGDVAAGPDSGTDVVSLDAVRRARREAPVVPPGVTRDIVDPGATSGSLPLRSSQPRWLRAAIIIIALSIGAVFVPPVRAWIVHQLQRLAPSTPVVTPSLAPAPHAEVEPGALDLEFEVGRAATFEITIERVQAGGELVVRSADVERASAARRGGVDGEDLLVWSGGLRISNSAASTASYELVMPARVRSVMVRIGARAPVPIELAGPGASRVVPLAR